MTDSESAEARIEQALATLDELAAAHVSSRAVGDAATCEMCGVAEAMGPLGSGIRAVLEQVARTDASLTSHRAAVVAVCRLARSGIETYPNSFDALAAIEAAARSTLEAAVQALGEMNS